MTRATHVPNIEEKLVVFFDICSSSTMLEDLNSTGNLRRMRDLIIDLKEFLAAEARLVGFTPYKFIGDGWVLLFPPDVRGGTLIAFLEKLSRRYRDAATEYLGGYLQRTPELMGLTFGVDRGSLVRIEMLRRLEYIGRALNVASRLQSGIKDKDAQPAYKVLFSRHSFADLHLQKGSRRAVIVKRVLRNIQDNRPCECVKLTLSVGPTPKKEHT